MTEPRVAVLDLYATSPAPEQLDLTRCRSVSPLDHDGRLLVIEGEFACYLICEQHAATDYSHIAGLYAR